MSIAYSGGFYSVMVDRDLPAFPLWWMIISAILWYAGITVWISIIIGFFFGWLVSRLLVKLGASIIGYQITPGQALMDLPIHFTMPLWKRSLTFIMPKRRETLKAEVRYLYEGGDTWLEPAIWVRSNSPEIFIDEGGTKSIIVWKYIDDVMVGINNKPLEID